MLLGEIEDPYSTFTSIFNEQLRSVGILEDTDLSKEMRNQVLGTFELIVPALDEYFSQKGGWSLVATEEPLMEQIESSLDEEYKFKGFIDLILKDGDGHYHVIDWKTCSWGWNARKKNDTLYTRQLVFYKHYYAQKLGINPRASLNSLWFN